MQRNWLTLFPDENSTIFRYELYTLNLFSSRVLLATAHHSDTSLSMVALTGDLN
jgi:hypothetical protein